MLEALLDAADPAEVELTLTDAQRDAIRQHKETLVRMALDDSTPRRQVSHVVCVCRKARWLQSSLLWDFVSDGRGCSLID